MTHRINSTAFVGLLMFLVALPQYGRASNEGNNQCRFVPNRADALDFPSKHAWDLFLTLVHPAKDVHVARGEADCSKPVGAPGTVSVWETWRLARTEVFLPDGSEPPEWSDTHLDRAYLGAVPDDDSPHGPASIFAAHAALDPSPDQGVFAGRGGIGETHVNRSTYEFIRQNCLYSFDGLSRYAEAIKAGRKPPISFPADSVEAKAVWVEFSAADIKAGTPAKYYNGTVNGKTYGLTALHILTKDTPNWFWATFHHVDEPANPHEGADAFGRPHDLDKTVWANYKLGGVQTDFISPSGEPTIVSDHYVEFGFEKSSCMTCHANAHGNPEPARDASGKLARDARGRIKAAFEGPLQTTDLGIPHPDQFKKDGVLFFMQTDFLWSIPFRAQEEKQAPPSYCKF